MSESDGLAARAFRSAIMIGELNHVAGLPTRERDERRAQCAILGHEPCGAVFHTAIPTQVCRFCLMRYQIGGDFGYIETYIFR